MVINYVCLCVSWTEINITQRNVNGGFENISVAFYSTMENQKSVNLLWNNGMCSSCKSWCTLKLSSFDFNATRSQIEQIPLLHYIIQFESHF